MADYGIVVLSQIAHGDGAAATARHIAECARLPLPTVSKLLKALCRGGLLVSERGSHGGYSLARPAQAISVVEVIAAIDGPIAMTECSVTAAGLCSLEHTCPVRSNWQRINQVVVQALGSLSLLDMQRPGGSGIQGLDALTTRRPAAANPFVHPER